MTSDPKLLELSEKLFKLPNGEETKLTDSDTCIELLNFYFPHFSTQLVTCPGIDRVTGGVMFGHVDTSGNPTSEVTGDKFQEAGYAGEIFDFYYHCVGRLLGASGILINGFQKKDILQTFENSKSFQQFEIDWVYLGNEKIVVIEVGRKVTSNKCIENKIRQMTKKSSEHVKNIISCIMRCQGKSVEEIDELISCHVDFVVCLPNNSKKEVDEFLFSDAGEAHHEPLLKIGTNMYFMTKETVESMCLPDNSSHKGVLFSVTSSPEHENQLRLSQGSTITQLRDLFCQGGEDTAMADELRRDIKYISAVFSISCLSKYAIPTPERFITQQYQYCEKKHAEQCTKKNHRDCEDVYNKMSYNKKSTIVLSPQQLAVLERNPSKVFIHGEAGSGKTTLLLAKLLQCCGRGYLKVENMKTVVFAVPKKKKLFYDYVMYFVKSYCHSAFVEVVFLENIREPIVSAEVILIDELYLDSMHRYDALNPKQLLSPIRWVSCVSGGQLDQVLDYTHFENIYLTILFRSAAHISSTATHLLNKYLREDLVPWSAQMFECFASNQVQVKPVTWTNEESLICEINKLLDDGTKQSKIAEDTRVFTVGTLGEIPICDVLGSSRFNPIGVTNVDYSLIANEDSSPIDYDFTGIEYGKVVLIVGQTLSNPVDESLHNKNCLKLIYNIMTRAILSFHLLVADQHISLIHYFQDSELKPVQYRIMMAARTGRPLTDDEKAYAMKSMDVEELISIVKFAFLRSNDTVLGTVLKLLEHDSSLKDKFSQEVSCIKSLFLTKKTEEFVNCPSMNKLFNSGCWCGRQIQWTNLRFSDYWCQSRCFNLLKWTFTVLNDTSANLAIIKSDRNLVHYVCLFGCKDSVDFILSTVKTLGGSELLKEQLTREYDVGHESLTILRRVCSRSDSRVILPILLPYLQQYPGYLSIDEVSKSLVDTCMRQHDGTDTARMLILTLNGCDRHECIAKHDSKGRSVMHLTCTHNNLNMCKLLNETDKHYTEHSDPPLYQSKWRIEYCIKYTSETPEQAEHQLPHFDEYTPLECAIFCSNHNIVKWLVEELHCKVFTFNWVLFKKRFSSLNVHMKCLLIKYIHASLPEENVPVECNVFFGHFLKTVVQIYNSHVNELLNFDGIREDDSTFE